MVRNTRGKQGAARHNQNISTAHSRCAYTSFSILDAGVDVTYDISQSNLNNGLDSNVDNHSEPLEVDSVVQTYSYWQLIVNYLYLSMIGLQNRFAYPRRLNKFFSGFFAGTMWIWIWRISMVFFIGAALLVKCRGGCIRMGLSPIFVETLVTTARFMLLPSESHFGWSLVEGSVDSTDEGLNSSLSFVHNCPAQELCSSTGNRRAKMGTSGYNTLSGTASSLHNSHTNGSPAVTSRTSRVSGFSFYSFFSCKAFFLEMAVYFIMAFLFIEGPSQHRLMFILFFVNSLQWAALSSTLSSIATTLILLFMLWYRQAFDATDQVLRFAGLYSWAHHMYYSFSLSLSFTIFLTNSGVFISQRARLLEVLTILPQRLLDILYLSHHKVITCLVLRVLSWGMALFDFANFYFFVFLALWYTVVMGEWFLNIPIFAIYYLLFVTPIIFSLHREKDGRLANMLELGTCLFVYVAIKWWLFFFLSLESIRALSSAVRTGLIVLFMASQRDSKPPLIRSTEIYVLFWIVLLGFELAYFRFSSVVSTSPDSFGEQRGGDSSFISRTLVDNIVSIRRSKYLNGNFLNINFIAMGIVSLCASADTTNSLCRRLVQLYQVGQLLEYRVFGISQRIKLALYRCFISRANARREGTLDQSCPFQSLDDSAKRQSTTSDVPEVLVLTFSGKSALPEASHSKLSCDSFTNCDLLINDRANLPSFRRTRTSLDAEDENINMKQDLNLQNMILCQSRISADTEDLSEDERGDSLTNENLAPDSGSSLPVCHEAAMESSPTLLHAMVTQQRDSSANQTLDNNSSLHKISLKEKASRNFQSNAAPQQRHQRERRSGVSALLASEKTDITLGFRDRDSMERDFASSNLDSDGSFSQVSGPEELCKDVAAVTGSKAKEPEEVESPEKDDDISLPRSCTSFSFVKTTNEKAPIGHADFEGEKNEWENKILREHNKNRTENDESDVESLHSPPSSMSSSMPYSMTEFTSGVDKNEDHLLKSSQNPHVSKKRKNKEAPFILVDDLKKKGKNRKDKKTEVTAMPQPQPRQEPSKDSMPFEKARLQQQQQQGHRLVESRVSEEIFQKAALAEGKATTLAVRETPSVEVTRRHAGTNTPSPLSASHIDAPFFYALSKSTREAEHREVSPHISSAHQTISASKQPEKTPKTSLASLIYSGKKISKSKSEVSSQVIRDALSNKPTQLDHGSHVAESNVLTTKGTASRSNHQDMTGGANAALSSHASIAQRAAVVVPGTVASPPSTKIPPKEPRAFVLPQPRNMASMLNTTGLQSVKEGSVKAKFTEPESDTAAPQTQNKLPKSYGNLNHNAKPPVAAAASVVQHSKESDSLLNEKYINLLGAVDAPNPKPVIAKDTQGAADFPQLGLSIQEMSFDTEEGLANLLSRVTNMESKDTDTASSDHMSFFDTASLPFSHLLRWKRLSGEAEGVTQAVAPPAQRKQTIEAPTTLGCETSERSTFSTCHWTVKESESITPILTQWPAQKPASGSPAPETNQKYGSTTPKESPKPHASPQQTKLAMAEQQLNPAISGFYTAAMQQNSDAVLGRSMVSPSAFAVPTSLGSRNFAPNISNDAQMSPASYDFSNQHAITSLPGSFQASPYGHMLYNVLPLPLNSSHLPSQPLQSQHQQLQTHFLPSGNQAGVGPTLASAQQHMQMAQRGSQQLMLVATPNGQLEMMPVVYAPTGQEGFQGLMNMAIPPTALTLPGMQLVYLSSPQASVPNPIPLPASQRRGR